MVQAEEHERGNTFGSRLERMFGYVTEEDRSKWQRDRAENAKKVGLSRDALKSSGGSMLEFSERNLNAQMHTEQQLARKVQFESTHDKVSTACPGSRSSRPWIGGNARRRRSASSSDTASSRHL